ncbi:MAG: IS3 family transposase, partial [Gammaproteobacteria bacterium]
SLKVEAVHGEDIRTREAMRTTVFDYIERDYNTRRHHSAPGYTNPVSFELAHAA